MTPCPDIFVVGTDTGVGKSVVSLLLMEWLSRRGRQPFYIKPFQTGCVDPYDADSDAAFVYGHCAALEGCDPARSVIYCHPNPKAPYFAARDAGEAVDVNKVVSIVEARRASFAPLVVEGAGGLMVPVADEVLLVDLIPMLRCRPLLVARAGLGTINHTLLSIEILRHRGIEPLGVLLVEAGSAATDADLMAENNTAIQHLSGVRVGGVIPYILDFAAIPEKAWSCLEELFSSYEGV